jgi:hypothetical protein
VVGGKGLTIITTTEVITVIIVIRRNFQNMVLKEGQGINGKRRLGDEGNLFYFS